jgi:hypothetical protein
LHYFGYTSPVGTGLVRLQQLAWVVYLEVTNYTTSVMVGFVHRAFAFLQITLAIKDFYMDYLSVSFDLILFQPYQ